MRPHSTIHNTSPRGGRRVSVIDGVELLCVVMLVRHGISATISEAGLGRFKG